MKKLFYSLSICLISSIATAQNRTAILEDFRAHKCGQCPAGDVEAAQIKNTYGDDVIIIAIHAGSLATPNASGTHTTDFRTDAGNTYNSTFGIVGNPTGVVNRQEYNGNLTFGTGSWESAVQQVIADSAELLLSIENGYDASNRELSLRVKSDYLTSLIGDYSLILYVLEDSIYDWQTDYGANPTNVENYLHNHVLRDNVNGTWGNSVVTDSISSGDSTSNGFLYTLDSTWDENQISIVGYIYDESDNKIINAVQHHINLSNPPLVLEDTTVVIPPDTTQTDNILVLNENDIKIFPNPATNVVSVQSSKPALVRILDLNGKVLMDGIRDNSNIYIGELNKGIYIVEISSSEKAIYKKIIIK